VLTGTGLALLAFVGCWIQSRRATGSRCHVASLWDKSRELAKQGKGKALEVKRANRTEVNAQWI